MFVYMHILICICIHIFIFLLLPNSKQRNRSNGQGCIQLAVKLLSKSEMAQQIKHSCCVICVLGDGETILCTDIDS